MRVKMKAGEARGESTERHLGLAPFGDYPPGRPLKA